MLDVIIGLVPAMAAAGYYFRVRALMLIPTSVIASVVTEWLCNLIRKKQNSLGDFSAIVTGIILGLSLPPSLPIWAAIIGGVFSIGIGKMVFGGLGANIFNPAMVGRAFLTASFGVLMTTWTVPATIDAKMPAIAPENVVDARTQATPLAWSKQAIKAEQKAKAYAKIIPQTEESINNCNKAKAEAEKCIRTMNEQLKAIFTGEIGGCLGETSTIAFLIGGLYLLIRGTINFHIPLAVLVSAFIFATIAYFINSNAYIQPFFHLNSGGLLLCAFFIATDPVTAPLTRRGMWIFGIGVGTLTMLIRIVGEYPEGVMFSVLLMNTVTPLIDRFCKRIPAGGKPSA
jgi:electron transport complex protein RnfD